MKQHFLFCTLVILACLLSCKKVPQDHIDATIFVKEYKTGTPIANARVIITRGRSGSGIGSSIVETLYTDNEGKVDYNSSNADKDYMYYAEAYKEKYFDTHNNQVSVTRGKKNFETTIFMYAESYVKLHVKNINPFNLIDLITIDTYCQNLQYAYQLIGANIDSSFIWCVDCDCKWFGNYNYAAAFTFRKNNIDSTLLYHFIPIPNDTITLNVNY